MARGVAFYPRFRPFWKRRQASPVISGKMRIILSIPVVSFPLRSQPLLSKQRCQGCSTASLGNVSEERQMKSGRVDPCGRLRRAIPCSRPGGKLQTRMPEPINASSLRRNNQLRAMFRHGTSALWFTKHKCAQLRIQTNSSFPPNPTGDQATSIELQVNHIVGPCHLSWVLRLVPHSGHDRLAIFIGSPGASAALELLELAYLN